MEHLFPIYGSYYHPSIWLFHSFRFIIPLTVSILRKPLHLVLQKKIIAKHFACFLCDIWSGRLLVCLSEVLSITYFLLLHIYLLTFHEHGLASD